MPQKCWQSILIQQCQPNGQPTPSQMKANIISCMIIEVHPALFDFFVWWEHVPHLPEAKWNWDDSLPHSLQLKKTQEQLSLLDINFRRYKFEAEEEIKKHEVSSP